MNETESTTPETRLATLEAAIGARFADRGGVVTRAFQELTLRLPVAGLVEAMVELRTGAPFHFSELIDLCGVDFAAYGRAEWVAEEASSSGFGRAVEAGALARAEASPERFAVVYHLLSIVHNTRLRVVVRLDSAAPILPSVIEVWRVADWYEREAFDLYGILFEGHPDLRRILTDYGFIGHPMRKDFPTSGHVEMRYDAEKKRVIYQPVTIEPREVVPRVVREDKYGGLH
jgi:NADH-quinone oxidoreductase subunit C